MKKDWTYKKLGEVLLVERGGSPRPIQEYITTADDGLNWIKIGDAVEGSKYITSTKEKIKPEGLKKTRFVHKGDFILSNSMSFGRPYILGIDGCIHDGWLVLRDNDDTFDKSYLYYYLSNPYLYEEFKRLAVGGVVNNLNSDIVRNVQVAIPPLSIQRSIVAELDLLHSVISKKKEQLRELDNLAQSLFYQMFGDPITNPMGWEIKKLGECFPYIKNGANIKQDRNAGGIPITRIETLSGGVFNRHKLGYADIFELGKYEHYVLSDGDLLLSHINSKIYIGRTVEYKKYGNEQIIHGMNLLCLKADKEILSSTYFAYFTHCEKFKNDIARIRKDAVNQSSISISDLKNIPLPLPPLSLQQSFAAKVSAIEAQKQAITQSIHHTEALLAQRMDNYFGI